jgi:predicted N-formylglutamate amidohydrolase
LSSAFARKAIVTAEHASNRVPKRCGNLGLTAEQLQSHIAWDPGSLTLARIIARELNAPLLAGKWSRLFVDLNRSPGHRRWIAAETFGVVVPGNQRPACGEREERRRVYDEFRQAAFEEIARRRPCLHLGIHTFTPRVGQAVRNADIGLLHDPSRASERNLARAAAELLRARGWKVRRNYPYRGIADGHVTALRKIFSDEDYVGIEIEVNQQLAPRARALGRLLAEVFSALVHD